MARITINDLPRSDALDGQALRSMLGGGRTAYRVGSRPAQAFGTRILDYPPGFGDRKSSANSASKDALKK